MVNGHMVEYAIKGVKYNSKLVKLEINMGLIWY